MPAQIRLISRDQNSIEAEIRGRGSCFYVIVGKGIYGNYLCIPGLDIGCAIAAPDDLSGTVNSLAGILTE